MSEEPDRRAVAMEKLDVSARAVQSGLNVLTVRIESFANRMKEMDERDREIVAAMRDLSNATRELCRKMGDRNGH